MFDALDKMCMENTIGESKNKAIKNFLLKTLADNNIIDTKTAEEKAADEEKKAEDQRMIMESALGKNTDLDKVNAIIDEFIADESIVDQIVDWFGKDIRMSILPDNEKKVKVELSASPNAMEHWALQYLNHVEVTKPESLRERIKEDLKNGVKKYK
jgi:predicted DNA-binding transcriptional regulator YafY